MHILLYISNYFIPFLILSIIICGLTAKIDVYETFITGAKNGCRTVIRLVPTLIGLMTATGILRASGFLDVISSFIGKFTNLIGFPGELVPLSIVKMFSSSAASGLLVDLYKTYGTDSRIGLIASLSMSCTETHVGSSYTLSTVTLPLTSIFAANAVVGNMEIIIHNNTNSERNCFFIFFIFFIRKTSIFKFTG